MKKIAITVAALALTATAAVPAAAKGHSAPDVECMQAGIAVLQDGELLPGVAKSGLAWETALSPAIGITVREGANLEGVPNPLPLSVILADHRAGDDSLFVYPWCE
jgi:hypothetical protein